MMQNRRQIVILDRLPSHNIEQAIFILRDGVPPGTDMVYEAERIVESYLKRCSAPPPKPRRKARNAVRAVAWTLLIASLGCAVCALLYFS